jgi:hypothetical protein
MKTIQAIENKNDYDTRQWIKCRLAALYPEDLSDMHPFFQSLDEYLRAGTQSVKNAEPSKPKVKK